MDERQCDQIETKKPIVIIADDFTGANDMGVQFARSGYQVEVLFDTENLPKNRDINKIFIYCTNSRDLSPDKASSCLAHIAASLTSDCCLFDTAELYESGRFTSLLLKKIDSTLRGNVGSEIQALLDSTAFELAIIAPASPTLGRVILQGDCYVHHIPLIETEFASDPNAPIQSSNVAAIIAQQSEMNIAEYTRPLVTPMQLRDDLIQFHQNKIPAVVIDSQTLGDLKIITETVRTLPFPSFLVGSSDMGKVLQSRPVDRQPKFSQLLAIIGSMSDMTQQQITCVAHRADVSIIDVSLVDLYTQDRGQLVLDTVQQIKAALAQGQQTIVRSCQQSSQRYTLEQFSERHGIARQALSDEIKAFLSEITRLSLIDHPPSCLYLSGGDIAMAIAKALGSQRFYIEGEVAGCVPWGRLLGGQFTEMIVMTKAGAFGQADVLQQILDMTEENKHE